MTSLTPQYAKPSLRYFATAAKGTEGLLKAELRELGLGPVKGDRGGVHFGRSLEDAFKACLYSSIAVRVLERRFTACVPDSTALYEAVQAHDFDDLVDPRRTLAVAAAVSSSHLRHSQFVARRIKDAVVDRQLVRNGKRSNVDPAHPDVRLFAHLTKDQLTLYADLSGEPLHRRGYRGTAGSAPLKETLAAALLRLAGYDGRALLIDPCCGSGTILCEAALVALSRAPGLSRRQFGLERLARHGDSDREMFARLRDEARQRSRAKLPGPLRGSDIDLAMLDNARQALAKLGVDVPVSRRDVLQYVPEEHSGLVVTNPPYGVRLQGGESLDRRLGRALRRWRGFRIVVMTQGPGLARAFGRQPDFEHTLYNGGLECRAFGWNPG